MIGKTLQKIRKKMSESNIDSLIIVNASNIRYLTGFCGENGYAVISRSRALLCVNPLYIEDARSSVGSRYEIVEVKEDIFKNLAGFTRLFRGKKTGFEADHTTCSSHARLKKALAESKLVSTKGFIEAFREVKYPYEIDAVKKAQAISERVFSHILSCVKEGVEERELALEIDYQFRKQGGERSAFETICASGPNTSKPHATASQRKIASGDLVLFDMGTVVDGYASDMTRTVVLGKAGDEQKRAYTAVLDAQNAALERICHGMKCSEADSIARNVLEKAGYGVRFVHSLGHGVGLDVHENPYLSKRSDTVLQKNSIVTIEPGVYIPGWGGIRIEDMAVITDNACDNLTKAPKHLIEL